MSDAGGGSAAGTDRAGVVAPPPVIFLLTLVVGYVAHRLWPVALLSGPSRRWVAMGLVAFAIGTTALAIREFRRANTSVRPDRATSAIVRTGPFARSRNPLYVSALTLLFGVALWVNSVTMALALIPAFVVLRSGVVLREERYLERKFGDEYLEYKQRVRRWL